MSDIYHDLDSKARHTHARSPRFDESANVVNVLREFLCRLKNRDYCLLDYMFSDFSSRLHLKQEKKKREELGQGGWGAEKMTIFFKEICT